MRKITIAILIFITGLQSFAQTAGTDSLQVFELGEINIMAGKINPTQTLSSGTLQQHVNYDAAGALDNLPGVSFINIGGRNESAVYIRGFDLRQVPVYIDGVPVYTTYDGYVDLGRFTTFDLAEIKVAKGFSSVLYGPNVLGGAINLISRKPQNVLEINGATGIFSGNGYKTMLNTGSNLGRFYIQAGVSLFNKDHVVLSDNFEKNVREDGGERDNSYRNDKKISLKIGFTPNQNHEIALSYINQQGAKGVPVNTDPNQRDRYWQYPDWDKESWYLISKHQLTSSHYLKSRLYYDKFYNSLFSYDDSTYTTQEYNYAFRSFYDDYTLGASVEYGTQMLPGNELKFAAHYKFDNHSEYNEGEPHRDFQDYTISVGAEDVVSLLQRLQLITGISYNKRISLKAQDYDFSTGQISDFPNNNSDAINLQAGLFYTVGKQEFSVTAARKTRFATMKNRYSYRLGWGIPNPDLTSETAMNYEIAWQAKLPENIRCFTNLFHSRVTDIIQVLENAEGDLSQYQNIGTANFAGVEVAVYQNIGDFASYGVNYTYTYRKNTSEPDIKLTDVPENALNAYVELQKGTQLSTRFSMLYNSERYSTADGQKADAFTVLNWQARWNIWKYFDIEGGINNIFDRNYAYQLGYPEEGRNYFLALIYQFN